MVNINTYSGHTVDLENPDLGGNFLEDIAVSLSRLPRYCGHTIEPYYIAQHCCLVADAVYGYTNSKKDAYAALMHEIEEGYGTNDICGQVKRTLGKYAKKKIKQYSKSLLEQVGVSKLPKIVDKIDTLILFDELNQLFTRQFNLNEIYLKEGVKLKGNELGLGIKITPWSTDRCIREFKKRYKKYV